jgi:hypothetical protein
MDVVLYLLCFFCVEKSGLKFSPIVIIVETQKLDKMLFGNIN